PSITALQLNSTSFRWIWTRLMLPVTTPVVALYDEKFTCQGRSVAVMVNVKPATSHSVMLTAVMQPMPVPGRPLPPLTMPLITADPQANIEPVAASFPVTAPDFSGGGPPGRTLQLVAPPAGASPS